MSWNENLTNLNYLLAGLYPLPEQAIRLAKSAGLRTTHIPFRPAAIDNWYAILAEAQKVEKVLNLIQSARKGYPDDPSLEQAERGELTSVRGPILGQDVDWKGQEQKDTFEKLMDEQSTLLPISFLELGLDRARSVARVRLADGSLGSGFLIHDNLFVTNHHVIANQKEANGAMLQFNYQQTKTGRDIEPTVFKLDPDNGFATSPIQEHDWTLVRVMGDANQDWGSIDLTPTDVSKTKWVNIIQHPGGRPKQIALYHNLVSYVNNDRVQYLTDT